MEQHVGMSLNPVIVVVVVVVATAVAFCVFCVDFERMRVSFTPRFTGCNRKGAVGITIGHCVYNEVCQTEENLGR